MRCARAVVVRVHVVEVVENVQEWIARLRPLRRRNRRTIAALRRGRDERGRERRDLGRPPAERVVGSKGCPIIWNRELALALVFLKPKLFLPRFGASPSSKRRHKERWTVPFYWTSSRDRGFGLTWGNQCRWSDRHVGGLYKNN